MTQSVDTRGDGADKHAIRVVSRRTVLAGAGTAIATTLAGCSILADRLGNMVLEEVNVFNGTGEQISGSIEIVGPSDETVLAESFDIEPSENGGDAGNESENADSDESAGIETYGNVWQDAGEYDVTVELDEGFEIDGETSATETVTIENSDEEMLAVFLGGEESTGIHFTVGESLTDFEDANEAV